MVLQRNVPKKLLMGESGIEGCGYGLYSVEQIPKNGFIAEYTGEVRIMQF